MGTFCGGVVVSVALIQLRPLHSHPAISPDTHRPALLPEPLKATSFACLGQKPFVASPTLKESGVDYSQVEKDRLEAEIDGTAPKT